MTASVNDSISNFWLTEVHVNTLLEKGFFTIDQACTPVLFQALVSESHELEQEFVHARISQGGLNQTIRGDQTRWLNTQDNAGGQYLHYLEKLGECLNQQLYAGIRHIEAHYATYAAGDFYKLHRDNPAQRKDRVISTVFYLNPLWQPEWQGELHLQDMQHQWHLISPLPNRLVVFQSNLLHEVRPATHERRSIAGWLRRDHAIL